MKSSSQSQKAVKKSLASQIQKAVKTLQLYQKNFVKIDADNKSNHY
jgi:hypothetical protein